MKQLISIIKGQIQQLPIPDLKHLLLSHLKEDAHDLTELFCQQIPAQKINSRLITQSHLVYRLRYLYSQSF